MVSKIVPLYAHCPLSQLYWKFDAYILRNRSKITKIPSDDNCKGLPIIYINYYLPLPFVKFFLE